MTEENKNIKPKKKRRKWLLILYTLFLVTFSTIGVLLYLLPRVEYLQREFAGQIVNFLNNELKGQLELDKIIFRSYNEIDLVNAKLLVAGDTLANIPKLKLKFRLRSLFNKKISVRYLTLYNPTIKILRSKDSTWNFEHIAFPTEDEDTTTAATPPIDFRKIELVNANFLYIDSTDENALNLTNQVNYSNISLSKLNFISSGNLNIDNNIHNYDITKLQFKENNTGLTLANSYISGIKLRNTFTDINKAYFKIDSSEIEIKIEADNFSVLNSDYSDLENFNSNISLKTKKLSSDLAHYFIDTILTENQEYDIELFANGNLKDLLVNTINIQGKGIDLKGDARIKNILNPDSLRYSTNLKSSSINVSYFKDKMFFDTEAIPKFGLVYFNSLNVDGGIEDYNAKFELRSNLGELSGYALLDISNIPQYEIAIEFKNLDLDKIIENNQKSKFNGNLYVKGENFDPENINGVIDLNINNSDYLGESVDKLTINSEINSGKINFKEFSFYKAESFAIVNGFLDIYNIDKPNYDIKVISKNLDLTYIDSELPNEISAVIDIKGEGIDINEMKVDLNAELKDFSIFDKHIYKYNFGLKLNNSNNKKDIHFNSDEINIDLIGNFVIEDILSLIENELAHSDENFQKIYSNIFGTEFESNYNQLEYFPDIDLKLDLDIKNLDKFNEILDLNINTKGDIAFEIKSDSSNLEMKMSEFDLNSTYVEYDDLVLSGDNLSMSFLYGKKIQDGEEKFIGFNLEFNTPQFYYNDILFDSVDININQNINILKYDIAAIINNNINFANKAEITQSGNDYILNMDNLSIYLDKLADFQNVDNIIISLNNSKLSFDEFHLNNNLKEDLNIVGTYDLNNEYLDNFNINLSNYDLSHIIEMYGLEEYFSTLDGKIKNLNVNLEGYLSEPTINLDVVGSNFGFNDINLGDLNVDLIYNKHNFEGDLKIKREDVELTLDVLKLPFNFNLKDFDISLVENQDLDIILSLKKIDAGVLEPFVPGILDIKGNLNSEIELSGNQRDGVNYTGNFRLSKGSFLVEATNMPYFVEANIEIENDLFRVVNTTVKNRNVDLKGGMASLTGFLKMKDFEVENFEFNVESKKLKVLRDETRLTMPDIYGDFVIATGEKPLVFSGNFDYPNISGDVDIVNAKLQMPNELTSQFVESKLHYEYYDNVIKITLKDTTKKEEENLTKSTKAETPFLDLINYDMNLRFLGDFNIDMELNTLTRMRINLGTRYEKETVIFRKTRDEEEAVFIGDIILKNNSVLTFLGKKFETTGIVSFPTGELANPQFDINAKYTNFTQNGIPFEVIINVKGYKEKPEITFAYTYNNQEVTGEKSEIEQNAFSLLTLNMLKEDALGENSQNTNLQGEVVNYSNSFISSLASKSLNDALLEYGLSTDVDLDLNNPDQSVVRLEGKLLKDVKWSVGGNVSNIENNEVTIEMPLAVLLANQFPNLPGFIQFTKPNNPFVVRENQIEWELKLKFGKTW